MAQKKVIASMSDNELLELLRNDENFNLWLAASREWLSGGDAYYLKSDFDALNVYETKINGKTNYDELRFHTDILPQPFIGNPSAPIWILLKNPGYSSADIYDLKDINEGINAVRSKGVREEQILHIDGRNDNEVLHERRRMVCNQLSFDFEDDSAFYILRPEFNTMPRRDEVLGGYNWYKRYLCSRNGFLSEHENDIPFLSRKIFILDYIPYHSERFCHPRGVVFQHQRLWENLVKHAIENNKVLVVRSDYLLNRVSQAIGDKGYQAACNDSRIFKFKYQTAYFKSNHILNCGGNVDDHSRLTDALR